MLRLWFFAMLFHWYVLGALEKPFFPVGSIPEVFEYKLFVSGKSGVGKTAAVAKLAANKVPTVHYETPGIFLCHTESAVYLTHSC